MRLPRSLQLEQPGGSVHKFWQCHNKSFLLADNKVKNLYMESTSRALNHDSVKNQIELSCYCLMSNHSHMLVDYLNESKYLSNFMRISHSWFGQTFNKIHNSSGKVANERPKTPLIQDSKHNMIVHFYIEANPIRAGFRTIENLKNYKYCSYGFYAYGIITQWSKLLTIPEWYLALGKSAKERQKIYRKLFREYLGIPKKIENFLDQFIGDLQWIKFQKQKISKMRLILSESQSP